MPEATLLAFANHGELGLPLPADGGNAEEVLGKFGKEGIDIGRRCRSAEGRRRVLRRLLERPAGGHRGQERHARKERCQMPAGIDTRSQASESGSTSVQ